MKKVFFALALVVIAPSVEAAETPRALGFDEAMKIARQNNPNSQKALAEVRRLQALVTETRASSLPTLSANGTYTLLDSDRVLPSTNTVISAQNQFSGNVLLTVPVVSASNWAKWSHAADAVDVGKLNVADTNRSVVLSAARAYLTVFSLKRLLFVSITARDNAKAHYDYAHTRVEGGVGNKLDEARAMNQFAAAEVQVQNATILLDRERETLGVLIGVNEPIDVKDEPSLTSNATLEAALRDAEHDRTDVKLARGKVDAAQHVERDSWTDYMPLLGVIFQPFYQNPPSLTFPTTGWQAQALLTWPIYDGGWRYGARRERAALLDEARIDLDASLRQASSDVRVAFQEVKTAEAALKAAREAQASADHALELANTAYQAGAITNLDVIDAERQARDAATQATIAEDTARQARLDLLAAIGKFP
jgi:outer membrane protein TolC